LYAHPDVKGVRGGETFTEVPDDKIIKGYEHTKGQHVLIRPEELDDLKLEKHTTDMVRFVDEAEKPLSRGALLPHARSGPRSA
jgi:non-homologous end joining protein Ku